MAFPWGQVGKGFAWLGTQGGMAAVTASSWGIRGGNAAMTKLGARGHPFLAGVVGVGAGLSGSAGAGLGAGMLYFPKTAGAAMAGYGAYAGYAGLRRGDQPFVPF